MTAEAPRSTPPIACDMSGAPDTLDERLAEYRRLFTDALTARERTETGVRFRLRADPDVEARVRDLAARELACCAFFAFDIRRAGAELWWDASVPDDDAAREILDLLYGLADA
jgi:hypothetical protein